jgi:hypothetical protein
MPPQDVVGKDTQSAGSFRPSRAVLTFAVRVKSNGKCAASRPIVDRRARCAALLRSSLRATCVEDPVVTLHRTIDRSFRNGIRQYIVESTIYLNHGHGSS